MIQYETFLAFAPNTRRPGALLGETSTLKEMASQLGLEGWRVCGVWQTVQGGVQGFGLLCQRPLTEAGIDLVDTFVIDQVKAGEIVRTDDGHARQIDTVTVTPEMIEEGFTCPECGITSYNPNDIVEGWCGKCKSWTGGGQPA